MVELLVTCWYYIQTVGPCDVHWAFFAPCDAENGQSWLCWQCKQLLRMVILSVQSKQQRWSKQQAAVPAGKKSWECYMMWILIYCAQSAAAWTKHLGTPNTSKSRASRLAAMCCSAVPQEHYWLSVPHAKASDASPFMCCAFAPGNTHVSHPVTAKRLLPNSNT